VPLMRGAEPIRIDAGEVGVLMLHRFTGTPASMRPWAESLAGAGYSVRVPRLPGHGTTARECNHTTWQDWLDVSHRALTEMHATCEQVYLAGLGMGGALALALAQRREHLVQGLMLVNPELTTRRWVHRGFRPIAQRLLATYPARPNDVRASGVDEVAYDRVPAQAQRSFHRALPGVVRALPTIRQPLIVFQSINDHLVDGSSLELLRRAVSSNDVSYVQLWDSYHVATLDVEADAMFGLSRKFVDRVSADVRGD
jgi:carboxylesterase